MEPPLEEGDVLRGLAITVLIAFAAWLVLDTVLSYLETVASAAGGLG
jgi:hypothetical protein